MARMALSRTTYRLSLTRYPSDDCDSRLRRGRFRIFAAPFRVNAFDAIVSAVPAAMTLSTVAIGRIAAAVYALDDMTRP